MKLTPFQTAILRRIESAGEVPVHDNQYGSQVIELLFLNAMLIYSGERLQSGKFYETWRVLPGWRKRGG